jgi:hypothetical protein
METMSSADSVLHGALGQPSLAGGDGCDRADANEDGDARGPQPKHGREHRPHLQARVV